MLFDSHCHLNFEAYQNDWQQQADDCVALDISAVIIGAQYVTSKRGIEIAEHYDRGIYATVGLHPTHVSGSPSHPEDFDVAAYRALIQSSKKVVGIGETGIDFFHNDQLLETQRQIFMQQIDLAREFDLPVVIHGRNSKDGTLNAYAEILKIVQEKELKRATVHCFGGTLTDALAFLDCGLYIGFTGIVTFKNALELQDIARQIPLERMLIETDAPYLAPEPHRSKQNLPQYVRYVAEKIAALKNISFEAVAEQTTTNARALFKI